jgi:2-oxoglutarate dehydrogenase E2 component (dihydrolipoamide succinyltransferase)
MATEVKVPAMGESISSGILAAWHVNDGDYVEAGQTLYDLETDKVTSEGTSEVAGVVRRKVDEGEEVEIGQVVAEVDTEAEKPEDDGKAQAEAPASREEAPAGEEEEGAAEEKKEAAAEKAHSREKPATGAEGESREAARAGEEPVESRRDTTQSNGEGADHADGGRGSVGPAVRRLAAESGVSPGSVTGTGPQGRVTKADMLAAIEKLEDKESPTPVQPREPAEAPKEAKPAPAPEKAESGERQTRRKMSPLRRKIAERLVMAQQEAAMLTTFNEVDMGEVMALRKKHQEKFVERHGVKLGFMSFFVKAAVHALQAVPQINAQLDGEEIVQNHYYDIGVAVGTDKGLIVPVLRGCGEKSFAQIETDILDYARRAREGKIQIGDLEGGVFTISNGGIYGSMLSTPILNPPQSGILGLHNIQERPAVRDGQVVARPMMYLALSYDHRIVDGKEAVTFLVHVKEAIEDPSRLLFGV